MNRQSEFVVIFTDEYHKRKVHSVWDTHAKASHVAQRIRKLSKDKIIASVEVPTAKHYGGVSFRDVCPHSWVPRLVNTDDAYWECEYCHLMIEWK